MRLSFGDILASRLLFLVCNSRSGVEDAYGKELVNRFTVGMGYGFYFGKGVTAMTTVRTEEASAKLVEVGLSKMQ